MPDISMCASDDQCSVKHLCYRSTASGTRPTEHQQSWMAFEPSRGASCRGFIKPALRDSMSKPYTPAAINKEPQG
jgi:hypothetical protein